MYGKQNDLTGHITAVTGILLINTEIETNLRQDQMKMSRIY